MRARPRLLVPANACVCTHSLRMVPTKSENALLSPHARRSTLSCRFPGRFVPPPPGISIRSRRTVGVRAHDTESLRALLWALIHASARVVSLRVLAPAAERVRQPRGGARPPPSPPPRSPVAPLKYHTPRRSLPEATGCASLNACRAHSLSQLPASHQNCSSGVRRLGSGRASFIDRADGTPAALPHRPTQVPRSPPLAA